MTIDLDGIEARANIRSYQPLWTSADVLALVARCRELEAEQAKDLADVERFRGMARTYMDERDALKAENSKLRQVLEAARYTVLAMEWDDSDCDLAMAVAALGATLEETP